MSTLISYKESGVDREAGDFLVEKIKKLVGRTYNNRVLSGVGGFAALYDMGGDRYLASGTDGVGTKLKLAQDLNLHHTIGEDLVAMCVNDILCTGARPLFFLDYFATGKLDVELAAQVVEGISNGCLQASMALIGGETAEMPGMYKEGEYDLAGFAVGEVDKKNLIDGQQISSGDSLVALCSSGAHSNGYSLLRLLLEQEPFATRNHWALKALVPTTIYAKIISKLIEKFNNQEGKSIKGLAHITGSGLYNIPRINPQFDYLLNNLPGDHEIPALFSWIKNISGLAQSELYQTFNMGLGMVIATDKGKEVQAFCKDQKISSFIVGTIMKGTGRVIVDSNSQKFVLE